MSRLFRNGRPEKEKKVELFFYGIVVGEIIGILTAAILTGLMDRISEQRRKKSERKKIRDFYQRDGGADRGAGDR